MAVSSDDAALLALARREGAIAIPRPAELATDTASSEAALLHALQWWQTQYGAAEVLVFLQCTSPFTTAAEIDTVLSALQRSPAAMAFSVVPWHGFLWQHDSQGLGQGVNHDPDKPRQRRQELPPTYLETGAIYALRTGPFRAAGHRFLTPRLPVPLAGPALEIDTLADLRQADWLAPLFDGEGQR